MITGSGRLSGRFPVAGALYAAALALAAFGSADAAAQQAPSKRCEPSLGQVECQAPLSTDPDDCKALWNKTGLPEHHGDAEEDQFVTACHRGYVAHHNSETKTPDWVLERLDRETTANRNKRPKTGFKPDPCVARAESAVDKEYKHSLYARGHQAASADFAARQNWMCDTFFFANAVPQEGGRFNSSVWRELEERTQEIARARDEIYVITGPVYQDPRGEEIVISASENRCENEVRLPALDRKAICGGESIAPRKSKPKLECAEGVAIPAGLFKIIYDAKNNRVNAYIMPNQPHPVEGREGLSTDAYVDSWRVTLLNVEDLTEYEFLSGIDVNRLRSRNDRSRRRAKNNCPATIHR